MHLTSQVCGGSDFSSPTPLSAKKHQAVKMKASFYDLLQAKSTYAHYTPMHFPHIYIYKIPLLIFHALYHAPLLLPRST